jgi:putative transposase
MKLGVKVAERTVSRLLPKRHTPPSQGWRSFLANHVRNLVSIDFFTVPTAGLRVLFVLVVLAHDRRRVVHFNRHRASHRGLDRPADCGGVPGRHRASLPPPRSGPHLRSRVSAPSDGHGIRDLLTAPQSPWQTPSRSGSLARSGAECLDHILVLAERSSRRVAHLFPGPRSRTTGPYLTGLGLIMHRGDTGNECLRLQGALGTGRDRRVRRDMPVSSRLLQPG